MRTFTPELALSLWYDALGEEFGIAFSCDKEDVIILQNRLYEARQDVADPRLEALSLRITPEGDQIWLYHRPEATLT